MDEVDDVAVDQSIQEVAECSSDDEWIGCMIVCCAAVEDDADHDQGDGDDEPLHVG